MTTLVVVYVENNIENKESNMIYEWNVSVLLSSKKDILLLMRYYIDLYKVPKYNGISTNPNSAIDLNPGIN